MLRGWNPAPLEVRESIGMLIGCGYTVGNPRGEDAELTDPGGSAVETWQEGRHPTPRTPCLGAASLMICRAEITIPRSGTGLRQPPRWSLLAAPELL